jgi:hypothetical protein
MRRRAGVRVTECELHGASVTLRAWALLTNERPGRQDRRPGERFAVLVAGQ